MADKAAKKSKFFRVAVSGATTDGRTISRLDIQQMAANYNPATYGARVNLEHFRSIAPDSTFRMYGDVQALKSEEVTINGEKQLGLFAQIDPTTDLVDMVNIKRQKVFTSIEIDPDFAGKGEAYLVGVAVTDTPASLGTEMLKFCAGAQSNPLAARKQRPANLFTEALLADIEFEEDGVTTSALETFTAKIKQMLGGHKATNDGNFTALTQAIELIADSQKDLLQKFAALPTGSPATGEFVAKKDFDQLKAAHDALVQQLSEDDAGKPRSFATGAKDNADDVLDC
ncbi:GPO family capsid scaffolding protein [Vogesella indigofera]|uniref:GPO family capsid scaffolding protein n=1 Tax=Vogesella indigofera TaxID=45465 RepID=UPI00234F60E0|nr:GPO family capsid scaffolding protein [Vogesella indigofera]MDC7699603.1 GPO family capsid scaffolding protein [Vogesella indigofera]